MNSDKCQVLLIKVPPDKFASEEFINSIDALYKIFEDDYRVEIMSHSSFKCVKVDIISGKLKKCRMK